LATFTKVFRSSSFCSIFIALSTSSAFLRDKSYPSAITLGCNPFCFIN
jgi:hypothetical protein